jgi:hypothetical protein
LNNFHVFVERIGKSKNNSIEVNLTMVWESGAMTSKVKIDEDLLTKLQLTNSFDTRQLIIRKVFGQGAI